MSDSDDAKMAGVKSDLDSPLAHAHGLRRAIRLLCLTRRELAREIETTASGNRFLDATPRAGLVDADVVIVRNRDTWRAFVADPYDVQIRFDAAAAASDDNTEAVVEADQFVRGLDHRRQLLRRLCDRIVSVQRKAFALPEAPWAELRIADTSEWLGLGSSTVGMMCAGKVASAPRGRFDLLACFSDPPDPASLARWYAQCDYRS